MEGDRERTIEEGLELFQNRVKEAFPDPPYKVSRPIPLDEEIEHKEENINYRYRVTDREPPSRSIVFFPTEEFMVMKESSFDTISQQAFDTAKELFKLHSQQGHLKDIILFTHGYD